MANRDLTPWRISAPGFARDPLFGFRREMDRLFDDFFAPAERRTFAQPAQQGETLVMPRIDVHETEQAYVVTAELPGIDMKDIELNLHDNALTLRGEKRSERTDEDGGRRYSERTFGRFERTIPFEAEVDPDRVEATSQNGVLKVSLTKNAQAKERSRRIEIRQGEGSAGTGQPHPPEAKGA